MNQADSYSKILDFFNGILNEDTKLCARVNATTTSLYFKQGRIVFDLPSLYGFIFSTDELSFIEFKQLLYASKLNKQLLSRGVKVIIIDNKGNVNKSLYGLSKGLLI